MSATSKKRKRIKLECLTCGSIFDDDYRRKHELNIHNGDRIKVKHFGAPDNPFFVASTLFKKKCVEESSSTVIEKVRIMNYK